MSVTKSFYSDPISSTHKSLESWQKDEVLELRVMNFVPLRTSALRSSTLEMVSVLDLQVFILPRSQYRLTLEVRELWRLQSSYKSPMLLFLQARALFWCFVYWRLMVALLRESFDPFVVTVDGQFSDILHWQGVVSIKMPSLSKKQLSNEEILQLAHNYESNIAGPQYFIMEWGVARIHHAWQQALKKHRAHVTQVSSTGYQRQYSGWLFFWNVDMLNTSLFGCDFLKTWNHLLGFMC